MKKSLLQHKNTKPSMKSLKSQVTWEDNIIALNTTKERSIIFFVVTNKTCEVVPKFVK